MRQDGLNFKEDQVDRLFPFHILIREDLTVASLGRSLKKLLPGHSTPSFTSCFYVKRPELGDQDFKGLSEIRNQLVIVEIRNSQRTVLRGEFEYLPEDNCLLFIGSPWFGSMEQVKELNLVINDFAFHDPLIDLLHVLKTQEITNDDLKELLKTVSRQKSALKKAADDLKDIALFPLQNPDPLLRVARNGEILFENPPAENLRVIQYKDQQFDRIEFWNHIVSEINITDERWTFEAIADGRVYSFECKYVTDQKYFNIYGRDVTQQKAAEEQVNLLSLAAKANTSGVVFMDENLNIRWANEAFIRMTGFTETELLGMHPDELIDKKANDPATLALVQEYSKENKNFNIEMLHRRKNGGYFWANLESIIIPMPGNSLRKWRMGIVEDVTAKKKQQIEIERLSLVASINRNGVVFTDFMGKILWSNEGFRALSGFAEDEIVGKTPIELCRGPLSDVDELRKMVNLFERGESFNIEVIQYRKDGSWFWGRVNGQPVKDGNGKTTQYFAMIEDITEEKSNEEKLKVLSQIAEDNINGVVIADREGRITWANKSFSRVTGYSVEEAIGKKPGHLLQGPETDHKTVAYLRDQIKSGQPFTAELVNYNRERKRYWVRIQGQPIRDKNGELSGFFAIEQDITKEKESEERFRNVLSKIGDNVWEHDFRTGKTFFLKTENEFLGYSTGDYSDNQQLWWSQVHPDDVQMLEASDRRYRSARQDSHSLEYRVIHKNGDIRWVLDRGVVIEKDWHGKPVRVTGTHTDVTHMKRTEAELANRVRQFQSLSENIPGVIYEFEYRPGGDDGLIYISPAIEKLFGITADDFVNYLQYVHPDDRERILVKNRRSRETRQPFYDETRLVIPRTGMRWVSFHSAFSYETAEGNSVFTGFMLDITERKNAEERLENQRKFYEQILNNVPADIAVFNANHEYLFVNPRGIADEQLRKWIVGKKDEDYCRYRNLPESLAADRRKTFTHVLTSRQTTEWEEHRVRPDGADNFMLRRFFPVVDSQGEVTLVIGYGIDITERKKIEQALKANEEKYRGIIANMNLGLMETDIDGEISFANQSLRKMAGLREDEPIRQNVSAFLSKESLAELLEHKEKRAMGLSEAYEIQTEINGKKGWWFVSSAPQFSADGKVTGSIVICLDITDQKKLQRELIEAREQAEQLAKAKESFLANMSHEIRTPMNAIIGMSNQLAKTQLAETQRFYLNSIHAAADNLLVIINDILDLSKIEAGKLSLEHIGFDPRAVLGHTREVLLHKAEEKGILLVTSAVSDQLAPVLIGDPYRLNQVLLNLMSNAIKFTEKGSVVVSARVLKDRADAQLVQIDVADTGIGMEEAFLERLFDKFSQEYESVTRKYGGTGLGMSISKDLVELMGGRITVKSQKEIGTTVTLQIEFKKGTLADLPRKIQAEITGNFLENKSILVVDDNELNRLVATTILVNYGANVVEAVNGEEALQVLTDQPVDLVLMDVQMPVMNGYQATREIRQRGWGLPVIALTANAIKGENEKCFEAGMDAYIAKPFKEEEFLKTIAQWLNTQINYSMQNASQPRETESPLYDLSSLRAMSGGNHEFIKKMTKLFCDQTPVLVTQMREAHKQGELETMGALAHKIKPSIDSLGIESLRQTIRSIEKAGKDNNNLPELGGWLNQTEATLEKVVRQLANH